MIKTTFKVEWLKQQFHQIRNIIPKEKINDIELKEKLLSIYEKRKKPIGRFVNNNTAENKMMSLENFINYFFNNDFILTGYNVLIYNQNQKTSIAIKALEDILDKRKVYKKMMEASDKGSHDYIYNKIMQLTFKILANSYYGITSMETSIFYNPLIQNSITTTGQDLISSAIYLVEALIANNEKFEYFDDILRFITNVKKENYDILQYLDTDKKVTKDKLCNYIKEQSDFIFSKEQIDYLNIIIDNLSDEDRNKVFYKNQIKELFENSYFTEKLKVIFHNGFSADDEDFLNLCTTILNENTIAWNKFIRISTQKRRASIVTDTDSTFIYLGRIVEHGQKITNNYDKNDIQNILNFYIDILTKALTRTFEKFTSNVQIPSDYRSIINMKNEFVYSRILTTRNKKNYGGWIRSELGKVIPGDDPSKHLDIKGLSIRKSTVAKSIRSEFQKLLVNDILLPDNISIINIMNHYNKISKIVENSLRSGKTEFLIPKSVDPFTNYVSPGSVEQVKATIIWNALEPNDSITPPDTIYTLKINAPTENSAGMKKLKELNEEKYNIIMKTVFNTENGEINISSNGFSVIAIPMDKDSIPEYIRPIINYDLMINANVKNANILLESLGIVCIDDKTNKTNYKTNILEWD